MLRACLSLALCAAALAQDVGPDDVNGAIDRAVAWLRAQPSGFEADSAKELTAIALVHAGVKPDQAPLAKLLARIASDEPMATYNASLAAVAFALVDPAKYRSPLVRCGQWIVDAQCANGQWTYDGPTLRGRDPIVRKDGSIALRSQRGAVSARGDNSNTQFALFGLWAISKAGIEVPSAVFERAGSYWRNAEKIGGGWSYTADQETYGSMTCAGVTALEICGSALDAPERYRKPIEGGLAWLGGRFSVTENPGLDERHLYYYLYSLERACALSGTAKLGEHDWYQEGARFLLLGQRLDGSWEGKTTSTCFAILFLRKATLSLVAPKDGDKKIPDTARSDER